MMDCFNNIKNVLLSEGEKIGLGKWKISSCIYEKSEDGTEVILAPGLVNVENRNGVISILSGSLDSLKFLEISI